jgi:zinc transport system substrate-binding protein
MTKRWAASTFGLVAAMALSLAGCVKSEPAWKGRNGPPRVVVTIPALDNFVRNVAGKNAGVICLCTDKGPHHYEYNPVDAMVLREADLFFAVGMTLDDKFADPMRTESHNANLRYVKLGDRLPDKLKLKGEDEEHHKGEAGHEHGHAHAHDHGEFDPHVWLGIPQAIAMVETIRDELKTVDPSHAEVYDRNAEEYTKVLKKLHSDGKEMLKGKKAPKIVAFHESLTYFGDSFGLEIVGAIERAPGEEPTQGHMKKLVEECKEHNVHVIAVEPQYPKATSAEVLKKEGGLKDLVLIDVDPLETADTKELTEDKKELKNPDWYEKKMRQNLKNLADNLP